MQIIVVELYFAALRLDFATVGLRFIGVGIRFSIAILFLKNTNTVKIDRFKTI